MDISKLQNWYNNDYAAAAPALIEMRDSIKNYANNGNARKFNSENMSENFFKLIVDKILGHFYQQQTRIKIIGRQQQDEALGALLDDMFFYFTNKPSYKQEFKAIIADILHGCGAGEVITTTQNSTNDIYLRRINPLSLIIDIYSTRADAQDARRFHRVLSYPIERARSLFGSDVDVSISNLSDDERAEIIQTYVKNSNGEWQAYFWQSNGAKILKSTPPTPLAPFIISKFKIDELNRFFGLWRDIAPLQKFLNYGEAKSLTLLNTHKVFFEQGAASSREAADIAEALLTDYPLVSMPNGAITNGRLKIENNGANLAQLASRLNEKKQTIRAISGLNEEALGMTNSRMGASGISQRIQQGLTGIQCFNEKIEILEFQIARQILKSIQLYFTQPQVFAIVNEDRAKHYTSISNENFANIAVADFDIDFERVNKMAYREEMLISLSEIIKGIGSINPAALPPLMSLFLKYIDPAVGAEVRQILENQQPTEPEVTPQGELEKILLEERIRNLAAQTDKLIGQEAVLQQVVKEKITGIGGGKSQIRAGSQNIDLRSQIN